MYQGSQVLAHRLALADDVDLIALGGEQFIHLLRQSPHRPSPCDIEEHAPLRGLHGILQARGLPWHLGRREHLETCRQAHRQRQRDLAGVTDPLPVGVEVDVDVLAIGLVSRGQGQPVLDLGSR